LVFERTLRGTTILLLSAVFISLGVLGTSQSTIPFMYAGIGLFLFYYVSKLVLEVKISALNRLEVTREIPSRLSEGREFDVNLSLVNRTFMRLGAEVFDSYPPLCRLKSGTNAAVLAVPAKGYSRLSYSLATNSVGAQAFGPLRLLVRDIAGLFFYERSVDAQSRMAVTPRGEEIAKGALTAIAVSTYAGTIISKTRGEGMEFADIRKYQPGDPYKKIEWSSTARVGELMVREMNAETQLNVMLLLDTTQTMAYGEAGRTKLDYAARSVASLVSYLSNRGDFVGLTLITGGEPGRVIPLGRGQVQTTRILSALSELSISPAAAQGMSDAIKRALLLGRMKGRGLFFVITDLESEVSLVSLKQLVAMKHEVIVISPYTPLFEAHGLEGLDRALYSINVLHQQPTRRRLVKEAAKLGIHVFDVGPDDFFPKLVARVEDLRRMGGS